VPLFDALIRGESSYLEPRNFVTINLSLMAAQNEDSVILSCTVLIGLQSVTDTHTQRHTHRRPGHG